MPWNRNRMRPTSEAKVPEEVEQYYQSSRKERVGVAWLLALVTLLLTVLLAAALFFGGRWVYRKVTGNDSNNQPTTVQQEGASTDQAPAENSENQNQPTNDTLPGNDSNTSNPEANTPQNSTQPSTTTPTTGPDTPEIPHTGPTSNE